MLWVIRNIGIGADEADVDPVDGTIGTAIIWRQDPSRARLSWRVHYGDWQSAPAGTSELIVDQPNQINDPEMATGIITAQLENRGKVITDFNEASRFRGDWTFSPEGVARYEALIGVGV